MRKVLIFTLAVFPVLMLFGQNNAAILKQIDSISQKKWSDAQTDLDSLANPELIVIENHFKDQIVIRDEVVFAAATEEIPITPYNLLRLGGNKRWFYYGQNNLVFNQSSFSNWNSGGNNNIGIIGKINYTWSYKNGKHFLDNNLQLGYGFVASEGESSRKTEDYINLMTNYGYDIGKNF